MIGRVLKDIILLPIFGALAYFVPVYFAYGIVFLQGVLVGVELYQYFKFRSDMEKASAFLLAKYIDMMDIR